MNLNLDKNKNYLLACSCGPDSMALFYLLHSNGYKFSVAHVNYHLRSESTLEEETLSKICNEKNIKFYSYNVKEKITNNIEERCREIRYEFFSNIYKEDKYDALLIAHNKDDVIETYLIQKYRNIIPMYYGIKSISVMNNMNVIRPLLDYRKEELLDLCVKSKTIFFIDKSNLEDHYLRNRFRHSIVEKLSNEECNNYIKEINNNNKILEDKIRLIENVDKTSVKQLLNLDELSFSILLFKSAKEIDNKYELSNKCALNIKKALLSKKPNVKVKLSNNIYFVKEYENCYFTKPESSLVFSYILNKPSKLDTPYFYLDFTKDAKDRNVSKSSYPLTIRNAKSDDLIQIKDYSVKARRLFIDWKMPLSLRKKWPVILDHTGNIIYIPRYRKEFKVDKNLNFYVK